MAQISETCSCGATFNSSAIAANLRILVTEWRKQHQCIPKPKPVDIPKAIKAWNAWQEGQKDATPTKSDS